MAIDLVTIETVEIATGVAVIATTLEVPVAEARGVPAVAPVEEAAMVREAMEKERSNHAGHGIRTGTASMEMSAGSRTMDPASCTRMTSAPSAMTASFSTLANALTLLPRTEATIRRARRGTLPAKAPRGAGTVRRKATRTRRITKIPPGLADSLAELRPEVLLPRFLWLLQRQFFV